MKSKTSFVNKGIFINDLKRFGWIGVLYALALFFALPLQILMINSKEEIIYKSIQPLFLFNQTIVQDFLILAIPVLLGIFIFRYMQAKSSCDMIHSLPIKRSALYRSHVFAGLIILTLPVIINGLMACILNKSLNLESYYNMYDVVKWFGFTILMDYVIFFTCVFVGTITGISIIQGVLTYVFLFLPVGVIVLVECTLSFIVYGFVENLDRSTEKMCPMIRVIEGFVDKINIGSMEISIYICICIFLYFLSKLLYNKRQLEMASQSIAFHKLQFVFKYSVAFCAMLLGGFYFGQTQQNIKWIIFGYFIGSFVGYFIAEMLLKKSLGVFKNIKGYIAYVGIIAVLLIGINFDFIGYEKTIPALQNVKSIYFSDSTYNSRYEKYKCDSYFELKNLVSIEDFHKQLVNDKDKNKYKKDKEARNINFIYKLKDETQVIRGYYISYEKYKKYFKPIYESKEYKKMKYSVLSLETMDIEKITINPELTTGKKVVMINPKDIKEAINVLKKDVMNETYENMNDNKASWANLDILISDNKIQKYSNLQEFYRDDNGDDKQTVNFQWKKSYINFEQWLKQKGYIENARILPSDIAYAVVEEVKNNKEWENVYNGKMPSNGKIVKRLDIRDKDKIENCLRNYTNLTGDKNQKYVIEFYSKDRVNIGYGSFEKKDVPEFIRSYFNK